MSARTILIFIFCCCPPIVSAGGYKVTHLVEEKVFEGTTLLADMSDRKRPKVVEVDFKGNVLWQYIPPWPASGALLDAARLDNDNILITVRGSGIYEINRERQIVWRHEDSEASHDADRLPNGIHKAIEYTKANEGAYRFNLGKEKSNETYKSFFSGHTSTAFSIGISNAIILSRQYPKQSSKIWLTSIITAATTGYLRIASDEHYATDVIAGSIAGGLVGFLSHRSNKNKKFNLSHSFNTIHFSLFIDK